MPPRILILDDRAINRHFLTTLLSYKGYQTREACDGVEGLQIVAEWPLDLAIVDIEMPRMDGVEFVRRLRANAALARTAIIFYTASYEAGEATRLAESVGVTHVLMKPSEPQVILDTVQRALGETMSRPRSRVAEEAATEFVRLHGEASRSNALVTFQLGVAAQRRPEAILANLARTARAIVPAAHCVVTVKGDDGGVLTVAEPAEEKSAWSPHCDAHFERFLREGQTVRELPEPRCGECFTTPSGTTSYIGIPIATLSRRYGWLCLMNREGGDDFTIEDERILQTIAGPTAMAYENVLLYDQLQKDADLLRATIDASGDGIVVIDPAGRYVTYNRRFVGIWNVGEHVLASRDFHRMIEEASVEVDNPGLLTEMLARAESQRDAEFSATMNMRDGRAIECHVAPRRRDETLIGHVWTFRDVTQRNRMESALLQFARDRELLLESTADGIFSVDRAGRCTMANRVTAMALGRQLNELIGSSIHDLLHPPQQRGQSAVCAVDCAIRAVRPHRSLAERFWRSDGSSFPVEYVSSFIIDEGQVRGMVVSFADVTERRRLERRLDQISRISSLGRMAATIAHEFNNVLMGIQPFAEVIRIRAANDEKLQKAAKQILNSVTRGKTVTQDIMRMTAAPDPALQTIDVAEWVEQIASEIGALVGGRITVEVDSPPQGTLFARCDPSQLQQVVTNLALNARDAMPRGGVLTFSAAKHADGVRLVVADTGSGIAAETLPFIFEPLFTTKKTGTGLGLAVAQQIIAANGGAISVESAPGEGTRFQIDLVEAAASSLPVVEESKRTTQEAAVRRVLVVEDDPAVGPGIAAILESEGVEVCIITRGAEALDAVEAFEPDVVLIDVTLPDISGTAVYEQIVERRPDMRVIFSTGHADESRLPKHASKHVGFLRKPYSTATLLTKLREVV